jgi:hypothetical protein
MEGRLKLCRLRVPAILNSSTKSTILSSFLRPRGEDGAGSLRKAPRLELAAGAEQALEAVRHLG